MTKRRKISEIYKDVDEINNWKPSDKDLEEISEALKADSERSLYYKNLGTE